jgi:hypothetical protein
MDNAMPADLLSPLIRGDEAERVIAMAERKCLITAADIFQYREQEQGIRPD